ncbi:N-acetylmuramoyl-L-alanine amidase [Pseudomonas chlororaphis]|uniref:Type IV secretion system putative lipoprotein virB7 n=1 Tax=Pseudomonas chlororaphis TaxID=587753 RepID=A0A1Q8ES33_9PSED|nr:N-acetylmuramoyl-L-alanine amidase [Pseudomonas chlororaphis]OLF54601.1 N-acetylmuramoyl-L-alanine amidase [Pseudomonas chlororaphis]
MKKYTVGLGLLLALAGCSSTKDTHNATLTEKNGYVLSKGERSVAKNNRIRFLVLHYTALDQQQSLEVLTQSDLVSANYLIADQPQSHKGLPIALQLVDDHDRAWHAGVSQWKNRSNLNDTSLGIEIVNAGWDKDTGKLLGEPYNERQIELLISLSRDLIEKYDIQPTDVVGHSDIAPGRKIDPGPFFPWQRLAEAGIGAWPDEQLTNDYLARFELAPPTMLQVAKALEVYGYGYLDEQMDDVVRAFQMRFHPQSVTGVVDIKTAAILFSLVDKYYGKQKAVDILLPPNVAAVG